MRILNLYAGIGGNRKLWGDNYEVVAVENDPFTAQVYQQFFPQDEVIIADAHQYLIENYKNFDFIWSSPPCPTHSDIRRCGVHSGQYAAVYPEMSLYEEIILLQHFAPKDTKWIVENVRPYYKPLVEPTKKLHRHFYWSNFEIEDFNPKDDRIHNDIRGYSTLYGFNIKDTKIKNKRKALRNMVNPELGKHLLDCAIKK